MLLKRILIIERVVVGRGVRWRVSFVLFQALEVFERLIAPLAVRHNVPG